MTLSENGPEVSILSQGEDISARLGPKVVKEGQGKYYIGFNTVLAFHSGSCYRISFQSEEEAGQVGRQLESELGLSRMSYAGNAPEAPVVRILEQTRERVTHIAA